jgi:hypothetical protein
MQNFFFSCFDFSWNIKSAVWSQKREPEILQKHMKNMMKLRENIHNMKLSQIMKNPIWFEVSRYVKVEWRIMRTSKLQNLSIIRHWESRWKLIKHESSSPICHHLQNFSTCHPLRLWYSPCRWELMEWRSWERSNFLEVNKNFKCDFAGKNLLEGRRWREKFE